MAKTIEFPTTPCGNCYRIVFVPDVLNLWDRVAMEYKPVLSCLYTCNYCAYPLLLTPFLSGKDVFTVPENTKLTDYVATQLDAYKTAETSRTKEYLDMLDAQDALDVKYAEDLKEEISKEVIDDKEPAPEPIP